MKAARLPLFLVVLGVVVLGAITVYRAAWGPIQRTDYTVYVAAGQAILDHGDIYLAENVRGWRYVYPPPFAILTVPLAQIPLTLGVLIWYGLTILAVAATSRMSAALLGDTPLSKRPYVLYGWPLLCLCVVLVSGTMRAQVSPFMCMFVVATFYFHLKKHPLAAGFSLACAALLKVFPLVLIAYFILRREWRVVVAAVVALAVLGLVLPSLYWGWQFNLEQYAHWFEVVGLPALMKNTDRVYATELYEQLLNTAKPRNQSLEALFLSLGMSADFTHYAVAACACAMLAAMWAGARRIAARACATAGRQAPGTAESLLCGAFIVWALLISPIAESHYFGALVLPLTLLLGCVEQGPQTRRRKTGILVAGTVIMVLAMVLLREDATSILIWLLCMYFIVKLTPVSGRDARSREGAQAPA